MIKPNLQALILAAVWCLALCTTACVASFEEATDAEFEQLSQGAIAWGDFDNDGLLDVAISGVHFTYELGQRYFTKIYRNNGDGTFTDIGADIPGVRSGGLAWGDFNNNGRLDLAIAGARHPAEGGAITRIYRNDGNGVFTDIEANLPGVPGSSLAWGDFNNDGRLDLAVSGNYTTRIFRNDGNEVFTDINAAVAGIHEGQIAWGDYNNNGYLDLAIAGRSSMGRMTRIYRNDNGVFSDSGITLLGVDWGASLAWGDFNNNGWLDLAVAGLTDWGLTTRVYQNNGNGTFSLQAQPPGVEHGSVAWGDFDNDGDLDLAVTGLAMYGIPHTRLYRNDNGTLVDTQLALGNLAYSSAAWGDFNGDGKLNLMLMGSTNNDPNHPNGVTRLFENTTLTSNTVPSPPTNSGVSLQDNILTLNWSGASDVETPVGGLSYSLKMGTTSGGHDVISGMADNTTGLRRLPNIATTKTPKFIPNGLQTGVTYYWSVQSIDSAFAGSAWSAEHSFAFQTISGYVTTDGGRPVQGVEVTANNGGGNTTTDSDGYYEVLVEAGWTGRVFPSRPLYLFTPPRRDFSNVQQDLSDQNFTAIPPAWDPVDVDTKGFGYSSVSIGDFNNDGQLDIAAAGAYSETGHMNREMRVYRNDDYGKFTGKSLSTDTRGNVAWGDHNNNGYLDIAYSFVNGGFTGTRVYSNNGDEYFSISASPATTWGDIAWGDFNNDGRLDLAVTGQEGSYPSTYRLRVLQNNEDSSWTTMDTGGYGYIGSLALADLDNDGDLDLMVAGLSEYNGMGSYSRRTRLYRNDGADGFAEVDPGIANVDGSALAWGDFDNDGKLDLAISGTTQIGSTLYRITKIYRNEGNGVFTDIGASLVGVAYGSLAWGDFNNNGRLDLAVSGSKDGGVPVTKIYRNDGNGLFTDIGADIEGVSDGDIAWGDFDDDGRLDLLVTGIDSMGRNVFRIYYNNNAPTNTAPSPPTVLSETADGLSVAFSWNAGSDAETPVNGLSYNLRVGSTPGGNDIFSGMADDSGWRRIPATGNAHKMLSWTLNDLPPGEIYWSVQAIDTAFAGSAWSVERSFELIDTTVPTRVSDLKMLPDDSPVDIRSMVISAAIPDFFYIQGDDRSSGIRVRRISHTFAEGQRVDVIGEITTNTDGERQITATNVTVNGEGVAVAVGVSNRAIGGGDWNHVSGTGEGQAGVVDGVGLNNIGLLVRTWGKITSIGPGYLYIDDGSGLMDGTSTSGYPNIGVRVICNPAGYMVGDHLTVTGISSCFQTGDGLGRRILTRRSGDIQDNY